MCILCVFYMCAAIGVIINDDNIVEIAWSLTTNAVERHQCNFEQYALRYWQPM